MTDPYQLAAIKHRRAELSAHLNIWEAALPLIDLYQAELEEIDTFLAAEDVRDNVVEGETISG